MSKKKHKKHEEHPDESWLVPYADVLTLLLALFIVLFAMSSVNEGKFKQLALSLNEEFSGGTGAEDYLSPVPPNEEIPVTDAELEDEESKELSEMKEKLKQQEMNELREIQKKIDSYIEEKNLSLSLKTTLTEKGLMITILDNALFDSGKADIKPDSVKLSKEISNLLVSKPPREILVSGHTDNQPISNEEFKSNWDLSTRRAVNFLVLLLNNTNLLPEKFSAIGYGEYQPVAENNSTKGREKNRRVEILILPTK